MSLQEDEMNRLFDAGFSIDHANSIGEIAGSMFVTVGREHKDGDLYVTITLPNQTRLDCTATREAVLGMVGRRMTVWED